MGASELFYRLEQLRLLGFIEAEEIDDVGVYYLSPAYESELAGVSDRTIIYPRASPPPRKF